LPKAFRFGARNGTLELATGGGRRFEEIEKPDGLKHGLIRVGGILELSAK